MKYVCVISMVTVMTAAGAVNDACTECHKDWPEYAGWEKSSHAAADVTCVDCHGGDPTAVSMDVVRASAGYVDLTDKRVIPGVCAGCHSDLTAMRQYGLPTDQMSLYLTSRHGDRLVNFGDVKAASCADCHGAHLVLPANDPASKANRFNIPATCAGCHSDKDIMAAYYLPADTFDKYSGSVHGKLLLEERITGVATCADCHGNHGAAPPGYAEIRNVCGKCHVNQELYFKMSPHVEVPAGGPAAVSDCAVCHGYHSIKKPRPQMWLGTDDGQCGDCHAADSVGYRRASNIVKALNDAKGAIGDAKTAVKRAAEDGLFTEELEAELTEAETYITEAYPVAHSLDLSAVTDLTKESIIIAHRAETRIDQFKHEQGKRRNILIGVLAGLLLLIVLLELKRRRLFRKL
ncbi:MAG: cytochrome c3 family protein [Candidatus Coatesbacteria bacterium]|nr:MAG: cytochrome c3 family protein [Candidatus Coatesbacteria bacterium]